MGHYYVAKAKKMSARRNFIPLQSNQIIFIGLRRIKDYYKRPRGVEGVYGEGQLGVSFLRGSLCAEGMGCERRGVR